MTDALWILLAAGGVMAAVIGCLTLLNNRYTLNNIKSKTVGDGQHGTARWATDAEIRKTYALVPFQAASWRKGLHRPEVQGLVLGSISHKHGITALVDKDDVHCLMIGASGVGKTAYFLYPNLEYACASGMSFLALDTKGDLARNYGAIAEKYYGYHVSVVDLRNPKQHARNHRILVFGGLVWRDNFTHAGKCYPIRFAPSVCDAYGHMYAANTLKPCGPSGHQLSNMLCHIYCCRIFPH